MLGFDHYAAKCPPRNLLVEGALDEDDRKYVEKVYDRKDGASDVEEAIRVCDV